MPSLLLVGGLLIGYDLPLIAQDVATQRAVVDSLGRRLARAEAELEALGRSAASRQDTLRVGRLTVFAPPEYVAMVTSGMEQAWGRLEEHLGAAAGGLARDTLEIRILRPGIPMLARRHRALAIREDATAEAVVSRIYEAAADMLFASHDSLRIWLHHHVPFARPNADLGTEAYGELATSLSVAAERCYLGDIAWCREALGLVPTDNRAQRWYDAGGRRALVALRSAMPYRSRGWTPELIEQCTDRGSDAACSALLTRLPRYVLIPAPLGVASRQYLFITALARGGSDAVDRLLSADGPLEARLVRTANEPIDSLLTAWRAAVLAAAPPPPVVSRETRWIVLAWIGLFTAVAVGMTRWS